MKVETLREWLEGIPGDLDVMLEIPGYAFEELWFTDHIEAEAATDEEPASKAYVVLGGKPEPEPEPFNIEEFQG